MHTERMERAQALMERLSIDALLITPSANLLYLLGTTVMADERLNALVVPKRGGPLLLLHELYRDEAAARSVEDVVMWRDGNDPFAILAKAVEKRGLPFGVYALEPTAPARFILPLAGVFPQSRQCLAAQVLDPLRQIKDIEEQASLRTACNRSVQALEAVMRLGRAWIGKTEGQFAAALTEEMRGQGLENPGALVCTGGNAAMPHYGGINGVIQDNSCLLVDFGGRFNGYGSDMSRTFFFGKPDTEFLALYETVRQAQVLGMRAAKPNVPAGEVDAAVRGYIDSRGYGRFFTHRTGHSIGLDTHEEPGLSPGVATLLLPGMVFTIEPGVYLPGRFGVRIENQLLLTEAGPECLHHYPEELQVL